MFIKVTHCTITGKESTCGTTCTLCHFSKPTPNVKMTSYCNATNNVYPVTLTTIRHSTAQCYNLLKVHTIKQLARASPDLVTPLIVPHWKKCPLKISSDVATLCWCIKHHKNYSLTTFMLMMYWKEVLPVGKSYFTLFSFENNASKQNSSALRKLCPL